jgi:hypothetical protein
MVSEPLRYSALAERKLHGHVPQDGDRRGWTTGGRMARFPDDKFVKFKNKRRFDQNQRAIDGNQSAIYLAIRLKVPVPVFA